MSLPKINSQWLVVYVINGKTKRAEIEGDNEVDAVDAFRVAYGYEARIKTIKAK